jgi:hypothetical protein
MLKKIKKIIPVMSRQSSRNICSTGKVRPGISSAEKIALVLARAFLNIKHDPSSIFRQWKKNFF